MNVIAARVRVGRKYKQVLDGARQVFMRDGFEGASVDDIARAAGVSKATLYSYFRDKRLLFSEVARGECKRQADAAVAQIDRSAPPAEVLRQAGRHMLRFFLSPYGLAVYRIAVAESERFPELGRAFYLSGPKLAQEAMTDYFAEAAAAGLLVIPDPVLAANQFSELCRAELFPRYLFGMQTSFTEAEIDRVVDGAVQMFMARYGT